MMLETMIKYTALFFCCCYVYTKALHLEIWKGTWFIYVLFSGSMSVFIHIVRLHSAALGIIIMVGALVCLIQILYRPHFGLSITTSACAFGISYAAFAVAAITATPIVYLVGHFSRRGPLPSVFSFVLTGVIQCLLVTVPFHTRRLKNGMPFLMEHGTEDIGVYISTSMILAAAFSGAKQENDLVFIIPAFFVLVSGLLLLFWWRSRITSGYIEKSKAREIAALEGELSAQGQVIENLRRQNEELSQIIHRDNKLIPAMGHAVRDYLQMVVQSQDRSEYEARGTALLEELSCMLQDRQGILLNYEKHSKKLTSTQLSSLDFLLDYMLQKAQSYKVEFDVSVSGNIKFMVGHLIEEAALQTLLADLIENAIIAAKASKVRQVMLHIGIVNQQYTIDVFDTGAPFDVEALLNIGLQRTTTHFEDGGSGIGMMSTFEIARRAKASLIIDESFDSILYTKCVSVCFDNRSEYRIKTNRTEQIAPLVNRTDLSLIAMP